MENKEILEKAIHKAMRNGYMIHGEFSPSTIKINWVTETSYGARIDKRTIGEYGGYKGRVISGYLIENENYSLFNTIFSHDFAKAFWGYGKICSCSPIMLGIAGVGHSDDCDLIKFPHWKNALRNMAVEKERLKYMEKFLDGK